MQFRKQKPIHHRLPFIDPQPRKSRKKAIGLGVGVSAAVVAIAGVIAKNQDQSP